MNKLMSPKPEESTHNTLFDRQKLNCQFFGSKPRIHKGFLESTNLTKSLYCINNNLKTKWSWEATMRLNRKNKTQGNQKP